MPESSSNQMPAGLDPAFLALLCCPVCAERPPLRFVPQKAGEGTLHCDKCGRVYPILEGLPDLRPQDGISDAPAPAALGSGS